jgi:predicted RNA binding protein YcfA (HicA-like mRNA interferase family)
MPHLRVLSGKDVCKILAQNGFEEVRRKGSHIIMQKGKGTRPSLFLCPITPN